jgi:hypothetical protein
MFFWRDLGCFSFVWLFRKNAGMPENYSLMMDYEYQTKKEETYKLKYVVSEIGWSTKFRTVKFREISRNNWTLSRNFAKFREISRYFDEISCRKDEVSWIVPVATFRNHPTPKSIHYLLDFTKYLGLWIATPAHYRNARKEHHTVQNFYIFVNMNF